MNNHKGANVAGSLAGSFFYVSQLEACNGITSVAPEFSTAMYHYMLPLNVNNKYSSLNCYSGTASAHTVAEMVKRGCPMTNKTAEADPATRMDHRKMRQGAAL